MERGGGEKAKLEGATLKLLDNNLDARLKRQLDLVHALKLKMCISSLGQAQHGHKRLVRARRLGLFLLQQLS